MPSYGIIDSQSVKTVYAANGRGIDGGKKIKGRKRHIVVDIQGNILHAEVHAANIHDTRSGLPVLKGAYEKFPSIIAVCGDAGYRGTFERDARAELGLAVDIVARNETKNWQILPKRWVVERTFAWFGNYRRLSKDYEYLTCSEVAYIQISHIHTLLKRLSKTM